MRTVSDRAVKLEFIHINTLTLTGDTVVHIYISKLASPWDTLCVFRTLEFTLTL